MFEIVEDDRRTPEHGYTNLARERTITVGECSSGDIAIFLILSRKNENWCFNFCWLLYSTILYKRNSDYNILRTGKMLLFSSSMRAMHGDMAKKHTLLLY